MSPGDPVPSGAHAVPDLPSYADVWKLLASTMTGVVVSGVTFWLVWGQGAISRSEAIDLIRTHGPYTQDRQLLRDGVVGNRQSIQAIEGRLREIEVGTARVTAQLERISETQVEIRLMLRQMKEAEKR